MLHWCKYRFLMLENNKSKILICIKTIWPKVKADQKIKYYFYILFLLFTVSHRIWFWKLLSCLKSVLEDNSKHGTNHEDLSPWLFPLDYTKIFSSLLCKAAHYSWLLKILRNLYSLCEFSLLEICGNTPITNAHKWSPCNIDFRHEENSEISALLKKYRIFLQLEQAFLK